MTVVLSSNTSDARLDADGLLHAIGQIPFIIYTAVYIAGAAVLSTLSNKPAGYRYVVVDVGLCALFGESTPAYLSHDSLTHLGGFTVLSTKAVSTLLTMDWIRIFTHPITYPVILVRLLGSFVASSCLFRIGSRADWRRPNTVPQSCPHEV